MFLNRSVAGGNHLFLSVINCNSFSALSEDCMPFSKSLIEHVIITRLRDNDNKPQFVYCQPNEHSIPLPNDLVYFCHPTMKATTNTSFAFTTTDKDSGIVCYAVCQIFDFYRNQYTVCTLSLFPFISQIRKCLMGFKAIVNNLGQGEELLEKLCENGDGFKDDAVVLLHEWLVDLTKLPAPVPGKIGINVILQSKCVKSSEILLALPDATRLPLVDIPLTLLVELLGPDLLIRVFTLILLEQKVVVQSKDYNALTMSVIGLVHLLYPLQYMFPVIPLLPKSLPSSEQLLLAPTPYLIGVGEGFFNLGQSIKQLPRDIWFVELDNGKLTCLSDQPVPNLPAEQMGFLKTKFDSVYGQLRDAKDTDSQTLDSLDVELRSAIVKLYDSDNLLLNIGEHARTLRLYPRPVVVLQKDNFLKSRIFKTEFVNWLVQTQAIEYYAEWLLCPNDMAFSRIQTGIGDPSQVGDKPYWYQDELIIFNFTPGFGDCSNLSIYERG
ncbi:hypothetical protein ACOME3_005227 [Neoechinorhynchus agilis]